MGKLPHKPVLFFDFDNTLTHGDLLDELIEQIHGGKHAALCLSGGGIRSATFGLGVIQVLAKRDFLERFHFLSTVSGGGYIGGWLTSWISRKTASVGETWEAGVERLMVCLKTGRDLSEAERIDKTDNEPAPAVERREESSAE